MKKIIMRKDDRYAKQGMFIINCLEGSICEVPDDIAEAFIKRGAAKPCGKNPVDDIEIPKQPDLETKPLSVDDLETKTKKELIELAEEKGVDIDKTSKKEEIIKTINEVEND